MHFAVAEKSSAVSAEGRKYIFNYAIGVMF